MAKKPKGPEDYTREELLIMAGRVKLKYRSRMGKEQLYAELGLGGKAPQARPAPARKVRAAAPARPLRPARIPETGKAAPLGMPGGPAARPPSSIPVPPPVAPPAARPGPYLDRGPNLPAGYGQDCLAALVRDPRAIFAYWELSGGAVERLRAGRSESELAGAVWVLRVCRLPGGQFFDIPVDPAASNWYVHVEPASSYQVKIGLVLASGAFVELAASRPVATPPESLSSRLDEQWMLVSEEFDRLLEYTARQHGRQPGSPQMGEAKRRREALRRKVFEFPWNVSSRISSPGVSSWLSSPRGGASRSAPKSQGR